MPAARCCNRLPEMHQWRRAQRRRLVQRRWRWCWLGRTPAKRKSPAPKPSSSKKPYAEQARRGRRPADDPRLLWRQVARRQSGRATFRRKCRRAGRRGPSIQRRRHGRRRRLAGARAGAAGAAPSRRPPRPPAAAGAVAIDLALPAAKYDPLAVLAQRRRACHARTSRRRSTLEATRSRLAKETILNTFRAALAMKASPLEVEALRTCWRR